MRSAIHPGGGRIMAVLRASASSAPLVLISALSMLVAGCGQGGDANATGVTNNTQPASEPSATAGQSAAAQAPETRTADQVLKDMELAYRKAGTYADNAEVRLSFQRAGQAIQQTLPFSVAFERPNKLRLVCYDAMVVSDGKQFRASVKMVPNLVLELPAPAVLTVDDVTRDDQVQGALLSGPGGPPVQLPFLMRDGTLADLLKDAMQPPKLIPSQVIDGRPCDGVEIDSSEGRLVLWIDQQENILRRIELPTREFQKLLEQDGPVSNVALTIEFTNAQLNRPIDEVAFKFEVPEGAQVVDRLLQKIEPPATAPRSEPTAYKLNKLWTVDELKEPGNMLVIDGPDGAPRLFVLDGWRSVVEIDSGGKVVARHELEIPDNAVVTYLRTAVDGDGKRYFVASADGQQQFHLFDDAWKLLLSYPKPEDLASDMIGDVQIVDLDGDGTLNLAVGYWGNTGVQRVSLTGERLWREPSMQLVLRLAPTDPDADGHRRLLCTNSRGSIVPVTADGKVEKEIVVPNRHMHKIVGADLEGNGQQEYLGLAGSITEDLTALGVALDGRELWSYSLPAGVHGRPIEMIGTCDMNGDGTREWLLAAADGSIHIVSRDGKLVDKFNYGAPLAGLAEAKLGDERVLLISSVPEQATDDAKSVLKAWSTAPAESAEAAEPAATEPAATAESTEK